MSSKHVTTISLSEDTAALFKEAATYYGFVTLAAFFRVCGNTLVEHHKCKDTLVSPLHFAKGWLANNVDHS
jgi:hypothetical protein